MPAANEQPIGVFDSGIGGLTVVRALMERLPHENVIYFGDTARVPFGVKSVETIKRYTAQITEFLLSQNVKMLVIACNTIAAVARQVVKTMSPVPVLDVIEAGALTAVHHSRTKRIGVIGTMTTISSDAYGHAIHLLDPAVHIVSQACPLFVPLVEEGWWDHAVTRLTAQEYLGSVLAEDIDTLVLGCTHYPLLKPLLKDLAGGKIQLVDSAEAMAEITANLLREQGLMNSGCGSSEYRYYVTDFPLRFHHLGERFLGRAISDVQLIQL
ncbi:MAG: glutamate racemase [Syntrophobacterales bacterium]|jgi:glutamate racemase|nr:glutamate racemase [Syntrophobacterales bacterium]